MTMQREPIPRLPVFGWGAFSGGPSGVHSMLELPGLHYTTSGRAAILLALEALGVGPGDQVLLPTYHCPTMVAPVTHLGATPVFYPIDEQGTPLIPWLVAHAPRNARVLLAAHYFGLPQPMGMLREWCDQHGMAFIEDCAHALFGMAGERPTGTWGDVSIGSLTKFLPVPEGGCLVMNRPIAMPALRPASTGDHVRAAIDVLETGATQGSLLGLNTLVLEGLGLIRRLRGTAPTADPVAPVPPVTPVAPDAGAQPPLGVASGPELSIDAGLAHRTLAWPCRWLADALPHGRVVAQRRSHYQRMLAELSGHGGLRPLLRQLPEQAAPYVFPLWVDDPDPGYAELRRYGMPVFRWDRLWPGVPDFPQDQGRAWSHHVIQLACHQDLSASDISRFVSHLLRVYATGPASQSQEASPAKAGPAGL